MRNTNFWNVVNDHPIVSLFALSSVVSGVVNIVCTVIGGKTTPEIEISTSVDPVEKIETED